MVPVCTCVFVSQNLVGIIIYRISSLFHSTNVHIPGLHWWRGGGGGGGEGGSGHKASTTLLYNLCKSGRALVFWLL